METGGTRRAGDEWSAAVRAQWSEPWGDRRQEIVFIGHGMDRGAIMAALEGALVQASDFVPEVWEGMADPFPLWRAA